MSADLPDPLVPAEVDLRDFPFFPIEFRRLFASDTWILGNADERNAAMCLWCESWHGTPAASAPDNDRILAHLSQSGSKWGKVKTHVMRGFVKCSDGRFYHPVVAEKVLEAWAKHKKASSKGKAGASKRWGTRNSASNGSANSAGIVQLMPNDSKGSGTGTGTGTDIGNEVKELQTPKSKVKNITPPAATLTCPPNVSEAVWRDFTALRKAKKAPITDTAIAGIEREAGKAGITLESALAMACERGWQGFKAEWLNGGNGRSPGHSNDAAFDEAERKLFGEPERDVTNESERI